MEINKNQIYENLLGAPSKSLVRISVDGIDYAVRAGDLKLFSEWAISSISEAYEIKVPNYDENRVRLTPLGSGGLSALTSQILSEGLDDKSDFSCCSIESAHQDSESDTESLYDGLIRTDEFSSPSEKRNNEHLIWLQTVERMEEYSRAFAVEEEFERRHKSKNK